MAELARVIAELRGLDNFTVTREVRRELAKTMRPFAPMVRAAILNIPTHGDKHTGLRLRIAKCVQTFAVINGPDVRVGIEIDSSRMPSGQMSLPLMMEGVKIFRHPVFGHMDRWVGQDSHEYFWGSVSLLGPASRVAVERALDNLVHAVNVA